MNPFQSDNIWKKQARQGQKKPLTPEEEWKKQFNSNSLWLLGGVVLLALYLGAIRAGSIVPDGSSTVLVVVVSGFCIYSAATLGKLWKSKPADPSPKKKSKSRK